MDKVIDFRTRKPVVADPGAEDHAPGPQAAQVVSEHSLAVAQVLEHLLERAKNGELDAIAGGFCLSDGATAHVMAGRYVTSGLLGALAIVQHRIMDNMSYGTLMDVDGDLDEEDGCED